MRKIPFILGCSFIFTFSLWAQQVIENSDKRLAKNAGRVLKLQEVWRITDDSSQFYFKSPHNLQIAGDGSIFIADKEQILHFSAGGKFLRNLFKKGQGPGEISDSFACLVHQNELFVKDYQQSRIFRMNFEGLFVDQLSPEIGALNLYGVRADGYIMMKPIWPPQEEQTGRLLPILDQITFIPNDGKPGKHLHTFRTRWFMAPHASWQWDANIAAVSDDGRYLFGCHSSEYLIEVLDLDAGGIVKSFRRTYPRIKHVTGKQEAEFRKTYGLTEIPYEWDVFDLFVDENRVWVKTSTNDAIKGDLFDVFDENGCFIDDFYLGSGRLLLRARGDALYSLEKDAGDNYYIVKYKIEG